MKTRREFISNAVRTAAGAAFAFSAFAAETQSLPPLPNVEPPPPGPHKLAPLPFAADALEPFLDAQTVTIHHDRHHASYVGNLNRALKGNAALSAKSVEELIADLKSVPETIRTTVQNQGGGHANHTLYWEILRKPGGPGPTGELAKAIDQKFKSMDELQDQLSKAASGVFGSGWAWLSLDPANGLMVESTSNQNSPLMQGRIPLIGIDVWEHAYYLKYQNKRGEYVSALYKLLNWEAISARYAYLTK